MGFIHWSVTVTAVLLFQILLVVAAKSSGLSSLSSSVTKHIQMSDGLVNENPDSSLRQQL